MPIINHLGLEAQVTMGCDDFGPSNQGVNGLKVNYGCCCAQLAILQTDMENRKTHRRASVCLSNGGSFVPPPPSQRSLNRLNGVKHDSVVSQSCRNMRDVSVALPTQEDNPAMSRDSAAVSRSGRLFGHYRGARRWRCSYAAVWRPNG